jgi:hypothetical protein
LIKTFDLAVDSHTQIALAHQPESFPATEVVQVPAVEKLAKSIAVAEDFQTLERTIEDWFP